MYWFYNDELCACVFYAINIFGICAVLETFRTYELSCCFYPLLSPPKYCLKIMIIHYFSDSYSVAPRKRLFVLRISDIIVFVHLLR